MQGVYDAEIAFVSQRLAAAIVEREPALLEDATVADEIVRTLLRQIGTVTIAEVLTALGEQVVTEAKAAGFRIERQVLVPFLTLQGRIVVASPYLRGPSGGTRPVKDRLGIVGRAKSPGVERALVDFGIEESFGLASQRFEEHYGFRVGRTSLLRVVERVAQEAETFVDDWLGQEPQAVAEPPDLVVVELDGCEIRTATLVPRNDGTLSPVRKRPRKRRVEAWREVRVGLAVRHDEDPPIYIAKMASYPEVVADLHRAAGHVGARQAHRLVAPIDGGAGLREAIERAFAPIQIVLDWAHCRSNLFEAATEMGMGERGRNSTAAEWTTRIAQGGVTPLIVDLRRYAAYQPAPAGAHRVGNLADPLERFEDAVHYEKFREEGLPIGSGRVEAAHRLIPQKRLKKPGTWWDPKHINPMLALRVLRQNGWWEDFCRTRASNRAAA